MWTLLGDVHSIALFKKKMQSCWICRCNYMFNLLAILYRKTNLMLHFASCCYIEILHFQRLMSRFEQRWRAQRSAISIVNCRIPWADSVLNTCCAFGTYLKVCLLQCSLHCFNNCLRSATVSFCASKCVRLPVLTLEACDWKIICVPVSLLMFHLLETFCAHCIVIIAFIICSTTHSYMKLGLQPRRI